MFVRKKRKAFSLVELVVVLFIVAAVISATVFSFVELADKNSKKSAYSVMSVAYDFLQSLDIKDDGLVNEYSSGVLVYKAPEEAFFYVCSVKDGVINADVDKIEEPVPASNVAAYNGSNHIAEKYALPTGSYYTVILPCELLTGDYEYPLSENVAFYKKTA